MNTLRIERLTREAFAPFGDVIELDGARHFPKARPSAITIWRASTWARKAAVR